jgi:hypothetical protein
MHPLIDEKMVERIRTTGHAVVDVPNRTDILDSLGLPWDRPAQNVVIMGCQNLRLLPDSLQAFSRILRRSGMDFTFLGREYCCGNYLYRPAIQAKDDSAMAECRSLSREFRRLEYGAARKLGARRMVLFCSPCYPIYRHAFPAEDIVFYPKVIAEAMGSAAPLHWERSIDYYAGCYRLHRAFAPVPMDLQSTNTVFGQIAGLDIHRISAPSCCFKPEGLSHMIDNVRTDCMVHICRAAIFRPEPYAPGQGGEGHDAARIRRGGHGLFRGIISIQ